MRFAWLAVLAVVAACGGEGGGSPDAHPHDAATVDAAPDAGTGAVCGGKAGLTCDDDHYCEYDQNGCGFEDGQGHCEPRPVQCELGLDVCGCDGQVYPSECDAQLAGQDVNDYGTCDPPPGEFACGHLFCSSQSEYCREQLSDIVGWPNDYACVVLPEACGEGPGTCPCVADEPCGDQCTTVEGGVKVTCPGG